MNFHLSEFLLTRAASSPRALAMSRNKFRITGYRAQTSKPREITRLEAAEIHSTWSGTLGVYPECTRKRIRRTFRTVDGLLNRPRFFLLAFSRERKYNLVNFPPASRYKILALTPRVLAKQRWKTKARKRRDEGNSKCNAFRCIPLPNIRV